DLWRPYQPGSLQDVLGPFFSPGRHPVCSTVHLGAAEDIESLALFWSHAPLVGDVSGGESSSVTKTTNPVVQVVAAAFSAVSTEQRLAVQSGRFEEALIQIPIALHGAKRL